MIGLLGNNNNLVCLVIDFSHMATSA